MANMTDPQLALSISFNDDSYRKGDAARRVIVEQIKALPEIADVWHNVNGLDADSFNVTVRNPSLLGDAKQKIEKIPGIEKAYTFC